jgi:hypothetical protein
MPPPIQQPNRLAYIKDGRSQIVFGNARGYFIMAWALEGKPAETTGTIETSTVAKDAKPADALAVPLAVDPKGRSAIMTGPRDGTGQFTGTKGKNVLWASACGSARCRSASTDGIRPATVGLARIR